MAKKSILNDVGTFDLYPVLATCASVGYGASGYRGFQNGIVIDRYFAYGHSTFFEKKKNHVEKYWKPFIQNGVVAPSRWDKKKPKTKIIFLMLSHPLIGKAIFYFSIVLALFLVYIIVYKIISFFS